MDDKKIQSILQNALEEQIPSSEIHLWPAIQASLVAGQDTSIQQGEKMTGTRSRFLQRAVFAALMIVLLIAVTLVTPQGRAFAQEFLQFFKRAESNVISIPAGEVIIPEATSIPTAQPPAPPVSVAEAESIAGFDARELPIVPKGFTFAGALANTGSISIQYQAQGNGGQLIINESTNGFLESEWDQAPIETISQVRVRGLEAEIVRGAYVVYPGETVARWNPDVPNIRLRWVEGGIWFEMAKFGGVESIAYLDEDGILALAESLTNDPFPLDIEQAKSQAGFDVLEPESLPDGLIFLGASFEPGLRTVSLSFGYSPSDLRLLIKQQPVNSGEACRLCGMVGASASVEKVQIGNLPGEYALGVWELTEKGPVWRDDPYLKTLRWQKDGMAFEMISMGMEVEKDGLIAVAESMK